MPNNRQERSNRKRRVCGMQLHIVCYTPVLAEASVPPGRPPNSASLHRTLSFIPANLDAATGKPKLFAPEQTAVLFVHRESFYIYIYALEREATRGSQTSRPHESYSIAHGTAGNSREWAEKQKKLSLRSIKLSIAAV